MNERIRELANQMFSMEQFEYAEEFLNDEFMEKFAELIVRECIELNKQELAFNAFERMLNRYREHFGVEQ